MYRNEDIVPACLKPDSKEILTSISDGRELSAEIHLPVEILSSHAGLVMHVNEDVVPAWPEAGLKRDLNQHR